MSIRIALLADSIDFIRGSLGSNLAQMSHHLEHFSDCTVRLFDNELTGRTDQLLFENDIAPHASDVAPALHFPVVRDQQQSAELQYVWNLRCSNKFNPCDFDVVIHSGYPYVNWFVQKAAKKNPKLISVFWDDGRFPAGRPQVGFFNCDGLANCFPTQESDRRIRFQSELIPPGVETDLFCPVGDTSPKVPNLELPQGKPLVLMIAGPNNRTAVETGIEAVSRCEDLFLVILVNQERIAEDLIDLAQQKLTGRHLFIDQISYETLPLFYQSVDLFLQLDEHDSFDRSSLEAAACGLAIVTADTSVARWIFGNDAFLTGTLNLDEVADAICQALEPNTHEILATRARARILSAWTWKHQAQKMRDFIYSLTSFHANSAPDKVPEAASPATFSLINGGYSDSASIEN